MLVGDYIWKVFGGDGAPASLLVIDKSRADDPEAHYKFFLSCTAAEPWIMNVSEVDAKALGKAIADGGQPSFGLVLDGKTEDSGGYKPDIIYNQADSVWEYSTSWDLSLLDALSLATEIGIKGTGVDMKLPPEGMAAALSRFKADCNALQATTDEGESGEALPDEALDEAPEETP